MFERRKAEGKPALVAYLTAGDPTPSATAGLVAALERGGADLIELGVPFSDPIADGPVIQRGADRALKAGMTLAGVLQVAAEVRKTSQIPIVLFSYLNPMLRYGFSKLAKDAKAAGIDGVLMTDASVEEAEAYVDAMRAEGLDTVFLAAPTSTERRLELVAKYSSGFVYLVSRTGVTGEQESLSDSIGPLVESMRKYTKLPLAVGFGISKHEQFQKVGSVADGVVVGSALVRVVEQHGASPDLEKELESFTRRLVHGGS
ncbi:tryptophan synthase alpha chain [Bryobacterales bacterium F-183]|nr:tryptophan synthase alpha chain [Bryobacterales bacterium F-183]